MVRKDARAISQVMIDVAALERRRAEIGQERSALLGRVAALDEEERGIDVTLGHARDSRYVVGAPLKVSPPASGGGAAKAPRVTHRAIVVLALERYSEGAPVSHIVGWGQAVRVAERKVVKTSISPLLKKMEDPARGMQEVRHDRAARRWVITDRGRETAEAFRRQWVEAGRQPFWEMGDVPAEVPGDDD